MVIRLLTVLLMRVASVSMIFFFFNDTATTEIYTLSLHDALPISGRRSRLSTGMGGVRLPDRHGPQDGDIPAARQTHRLPGADRKSTRLNSSHSQISYAVFCLKKKTIYIIADHHSTGARRTVIHSN